jgi:O-methyltransferase domain/Dimerisation domain
MTPPRSAVRDASQSERGSGNMRQLVAMENEMEMAAEGDAQAVVGGLIDGGWRAQIVAAFVQLGLADLLFERPMSAGDLARAANAHPDALQRLLSAASALGLCANAGDVVRLTEAGELLATSHPESMQPSAELLTGPWLARAWEHLADSVRTGDAGFPLAHGTDFWAYVATHPDEAAFFHDAMSHSARDRADVLSTHVDLSRVNTVVDVGGGKGELLAHVLSTHGHLHGIVADRSNVVASAQPSGEASSERLEFQAVDFFGDIPRGGDLYVLSRILHDWDDAHALDILRSCRRAMTSGARLCIVEEVVSGDENLTRDEAVDAAVKDLNMLVLVGGRERTAHQYETMLTETGFGDVTCTITGRGADIVIATAS